MRIAALALLAVTAVILGCSPDATDEGSPRARPKLRVAVRPEPIEFLPRNADPVTIDREIAAGLAEDLGRELELVLVDDYSLVIEHLLDGRADLAAANLTATPERDELVDFSVPYLHVDELLVARRESSDYADELSVCLRASSSYASTLSGLLAEGSKLGERLMPETLSVEGILERVDRGECEATIVDSHIWAALSAHYPDLVAVRTLARHRPIALAFPPGAEDLRRRANEFLIARALTAGRDEIYREDLPALKARRRLRMITRNNSATYFLHRGEQRGFEYELLERFADFHGLRLEIVIPPSREDLVPWLLEGRGDVLAAAWAITPERAENVAFTRSFLSVEEVVVAREDDPLAGPTDLAGRTIHVRRSSAHRAALDELFQRSPVFNTVFAPEELETEEILARVEDGTWDLAVASSHQLELERNAGRKLRAALTVGKADLGWAVRPEDGELHAALDDFLRREDRGLFYNMTRDRYFRTPGAIVNGQDEWRSDRSGRISPWDDLARRYAGQFDLDWRLVVAQMYQESRFDPDRVSWSGAKGLMQIVPRTARELGIDDPTDPESSVRGGTRYFRWLLDQFDPQLPLATRIRFALASYNAGRSHVLDARRLAARQGLSPDEWYGHVEKAMLLLQRPEFYEQARFGYCRGSECARYVREIDRRYRRYVRHVPG